MQPANRTMKANTRKVAIMPLQLRHVLEVHAVDPRQKGEGHEDGGDDGEDLHDLVQAVADAGEIDIQQAR